MAHRRDHTISLMNDIKDVLQKCANCDILPKAHTVHIQETSSPLMLEVKVQYEIGEWQTYELVLSHRKKERPR